jgi:hypothetical protein
MARTRRTFTDDAGYEIESQFAEANGRSHADDPELAELVQRFAMLTITMQQEKSKNAGVILAFGLVPVAFVLAMVVFPSARSSPLTYLIVAACIGVAIWGLRRRVNGEFESEFRGFLVSHGRCGGCGYPLGNLPVDRFGLCVCAECRASWRVSRVRFATSELVRGAHPEAPDDSVSLIRQFLGFNRLFPAVKDLEGRVFRTVDPRLIGARAWLGDTWESRRDGVLRRLRGARLKHMVFAMVLVPGVLMSIGTATHGLRAAMNGIMPTGMQILAAVVFVSFVISYPHMVWQIWSFRSPLFGRRIEKSLLDEGLCPGCAHELPSGVDRVQLRRTCGHCGGVWEGSTPHSTRAR